MGLSEYLRYKVLGKGSYGKVFLVKHVQEDRLYALKMIDQRKITPEEKESAQRELQLMKQFTHPNIVAYRDGFYTSNASYFCIVMTYCEGGDLQSVLTKAQKAGEPLAESLIMNYFVQILLGLEFMHHNKVLHRDLKAQNLFLLGNGRLVLGDLGIARSIGVNLAQTTVGTPLYMSPEIYNRLPYDLKSDIWSLGCVFYEMLTFRHPFEGNSLIALSHCVRRGVFKPVPSVYSRDSQDLLQCMLTVDPARRPSAEELFSRPFVQFHVAELINDILVRPEEALGEGTIQIRHAVLAGASEGSLDWTITSKLPSSSPQARTLCAQLCYLRLNSPIHERIQSKASAPRGKDDEESRRLDYQRDLEIQLKRREAMRNAVRSMEKTKKAVLAREVAEKPPVLLQAPRAPSNPPPPPPSVVPPVCPNSAGRIGFSAASPSPPPLPGPPRAPIGRPSSELQPPLARVPSPPRAPRAPHSFVIPPQRREAAEAVAPRVPEPPIREVAHAAPPPRVPYSSVRSEAAGPPPPPRGACPRPPEPTSVAHPAPSSHATKFAVVSESPSSEGELMDTPGRFPPKDSFNTQMPRISSDIARREEELKRELQNVERMMAFIGNDSKQTGLRVESSESESSASFSSSSSESEEDHPASAPVFVAASTDRRAQLGQRLIAATGRERFQSVYSLFSNRRRENGGQDLDPSDATLSAQLRARLGPAASHTDLPRLISDFNQLFFLESFQQ